MSWFERSSILDKKEQTMQRNTKFSARFSPEDQALLVHIAACLQRTKSDTVRILIYEKAYELGLDTGYLSPHQPVSREGQLTRP